MMFLGGSGGVALWTVEFVFRVNLLRGSVVHSLALKLNSDLWTDSSRSWPVPALNTLDFVG
jgi:hypothetical protein